MDQFTIQPNRPHHVVARELVQEHIKLTSLKPEWPRSNIELQQLREKILVLQKKKKFHVDIQQGGFVIDEGYNGVDKYIRFYPRSSIYNRFVVNDLISIVTQIIPKILESKPTLKVNALYNIEMHSLSDPETVQNRLIRSYGYIVTRATDLEDLAKTFFQEISRNFEAHNSEGSGWAYNKTNYIQISSHAFDVQTGASYKPLPLKIQSTKSCINVGNDDNKCVLWALLSACFPVRDHPDRVTKYKHIQHVIDMTGIDFPTPIKQVSRIEKQNPKLFPSGINVFSLDDQPRVFPYLISPSSKHCTDNSAVNLLYHDDHYVFIKDLSRLMSSNMSGYQHKMFFCYSCLCGFRSQTELVEHNKYCFEVKAVITPKEPKNICEFKKIERTRKLPWCFYGDFESFIIPVDNDKCICDKQVCDCNIKTLSMQKHIPASYQISRVCSNEKFSALSPIYLKNTHSDVSPEVHMLKYLFEQVKYIESLLSMEQQRFITLKSFTNAVKCYACKKDFTDNNNPKVPYFDVVNNNYIGAVHQRCRCFQKFYPVIFHNLRGYDGHFILRALGDPAISKYLTDNNITLNCIPNNMERLMSITVGKLRFIDSLQFMNSSLEQLAKNCGSYPITEKHFPRKNLEISQVLKLITVKGIFPYEYFDGPERFSDTSLPGIDKFYSSLSETNISNEEYNRAIATWEMFGCSNFGDYHDIYLTVDVLLLSDIFEEFRKTSLHVYGLDPAHYYSAPGLSWDALLKSTGIKLELLTDVNMYLFIEKAIRGGISVIVKKHSIANNKYLSGYDENLPDNAIVYLDMNNLYGAAMSAAMPYGGFAWISTEEFLSEASTSKPDADLSKITLKSNEHVGYFIECDIDVPDCIHDAHRDYPFLVEKMIITDEMLSTEQLALRTVKYNPIQKLVPTLTNKRNYICHVEILSQAINAGLILRKIHKVLRFKHSRWMKPYIDGNTARRTIAKNDFEKDFFKLMNNSVFGKTMENIRKRTNIKIVTSVARRNKLVRKNSFEEIKKITNTLSLIKVKQSRLFLDKPVYVGASVLDISKLYMYDFHYNVAKKSWRNCRLLFTDTDSLVYEIPGSDCNNDVYESIYKIKDLFDLSDVSGKFHDSTNKKVIGKMKDEFAFKPIREFVGLRSKMYSVLTDNCTIVNKAKGINNKYVKKKLSFDDYLSALSRPPGQQLQQITTFGFRSHEHNIFTTRITKSGLCNFDDKRYCRDGINTLPFGHYLIRSN